MADSTVVPVCKQCEGLNTRLPNKDLQKVSQGPAQQDPLTGSDCRLLTELC